MRLHPAHNRDDHNADQACIRQARFMFDTGVSNPR
jgi:hypothetical protein